MMKYLDINSITVDRFLPPINPGARKAKECRDSNRVIFQWT